MPHNYLASFIGDHPDSSTDFFHTMERQYRSMFENAVSGIFQTTPDGHYLIANPALAHLYGYDTPDQLVKGLQDIKNQLYVNPQRRDEFITALREHDVVAEFESQIYRQDGQIIWISENARAVRDEQGNLLYYEGFVEDITQRKQAEIGLKESEERLRLLIEGVKDYALFMLDVHGHVISWNAGAERIYGYSTEEIIGQHFSIFYINDDLQVNLPAKEMLQAGELGRFEQEGYRLHKNGHTFWANTITTALYDEKKQLRGFAKVTQDITAKKQAEIVQSQLIASLQLSEKKFRNLFEFTTDAVILMAEDTILDCNRAAVELFGCENKEQFCQNKFSNFSRELLPDGEASTAEIMKEYMNLAFSRGSFRFDWQYKRLDGQVFPAEVLLTAMEIDGQPALQAVVRDITYRVLVEEKLRQANEELEERVVARTTLLQETLAKFRLSEEKFKIAFRSSPDPIMITTLRADIILEVNDSFLQMVNRPAEEVIGAKFTDLGIWQEPATKKYLYHLLQKSGVVRNLECEFQVNNSNLRIGLLSAELIHISDEVCVLTVISDITERKRAEIALQESQRTLTNLMANIPGMVYRCRYEEGWTMEFVSEGSIALTGYTPEELLLSFVTSYDDLIHPEHRASVWQIVTNAIREKIPYQLVYRLLTKEGKTKWVWEQGVAVYGENDQVLALEGLIMDITESKMTENELRRSQSELKDQKRQLEHTLEELQQTQATLIHSEKMSSLGQMVAGIAHEIKNPVTCVCGNMSHLSLYTQDVIDLLHLYQKYYPQPATEIAETIEKVDLDFLLTDFPQVISSVKLGADRIQEIVRSLRNFSRSDESYRSQVDLHEGIEGTLVILQNRLKPQAGRAEILVQKNYHKLPLVECYAGQINQVIMNLIGNAIEALEEFMEQLDVPPMITISTEVIYNSWHEPERVRIAIADNGPGIPADVQPYIFEKFFTTKDVGKGTGLGLSISYQIITEKHHGVLKCVSQEGKGTTFIMEIPVYLPEVTIVGGG